jgi:hypothetical protein
MRPGDPRRSRNYRLPTGKDGSDKFSCESSRESCSYDVAIYLVNCNRDRFLSVPCDKVGEWAANINAKCCGGHLSTDMCDNDTLSRCARMKSGGVKKDEISKHYVDVRKRDDLGKRC